MNKKYIMALSVVLTQTPFLKASSENSHQHGERETHFEQSLPKKWEDAIGLLAVTSNPIRMSTIENNVAISTFTVSSDGSLTQVGQPTPVGGSSQQPTVSPDGQFLFLSNFNNGGTVLAFRVADNGSLNQVGQPTPIGGSPQQPTISSDGQFLFVSSRGDDTVSVFRVADDGLLTQVGQPTPTGQSPLRPIISPDGRFLFVFNRGDDTVSVFRVADNGSLTQAGPPTPIGQSPLRPIISPDGRFLFVSNIHADTVSAFRVAGNGSLTQVGQPTPTGQSPLTPTISPDGQFLFVSNSNDNTVSVFRVADNGSLTQVGQPTPTVLPQHQTISPDGLLLFDGITSVFRVADNGELAIARYSDRRQQQLDRLFDRPVYIPLPKRWREAQAARLVANLGLFQEELELEGSLPSDLEQLVTQIALGEDIRLTKSVKALIKLRREGASSLSFDELQEFLTLAYDPTRIAGGLFHQLLSPFLNVQRGTLTPEGFRIVDEWIMKQDNLEIYRNQINQRLQNENNEKARSILRAIKDRIDVQLRSMDY